MSLEALTKFKQEIEGWEGEIGLRANRLDPNELDALLNMSRANLETRGAETLSNDAIVLAQFAFVLQHRENQCRVFQTWARNHRQSMPTVNEKLMLDHLVEQAEVKAGRIAYLARRVEFIAQCVTNAARARSSK